MARQIPDEWKTKELKNTLKLKLIRELYTRSYFEFFKFAAQILEPDTKWDFKNWHVEYLCNRMQIIAERQIKDELSADKHIFNLPPSSSKSMICSIIYSVWLLCQKPTLKILVITYSENLAKTFGSKIRALLKSPYIKNIYPELNVDKEVDSMGRTRISLYNGEIVVTNKTVTGNHFNFIICDDFMNTQFIRSRAYREERYHLFFKLLPSRVPNDKSPIIVVEQRLKGDITGEILKRGLEYKHTSIPLEKREGVISPSTLSENYGRTFWDKRYSIHAVNDLKKSLGSITFETQYNQTIPDEVNLIKSEYFDFFILGDITKKLKASEEVNPRWIPKIVNRHEIIKWHCFVDPSFGITDPTAFLTAGMYEGKILIKDVTVTKLNFNDLIRYSQQYASIHDVSAFHIEPAASGRPMVERLTVESELPIYMTAPPTISKEQRVQRCLPQLETNRVMLAEDPIWNDLFIDECVSFPEGVHDDQVDVLTMAIDYFLPYSKSKENYTDMVDNTKKQNLTKRKFNGFV
jgi:predicted phage terminase large subunit-like protein